MIIDANFIIIQSNFNKQQLYSISHQRVSVQINCNKCFAYVLEHSSMFWEIRLTAFLQRVR